MIIACFQLVFYRKLGGQRLKFSAQTAKRILHASKYYIIPNLMIVVFANTDRVMLKYMIGADATGYYSAAVYCAGIASFVFLAIINSFRPAIFEAAKASNTAFENRLLSLFRIIVFFSLLLSIFMTLFPELLISILYGEKYAAAVPALRIVVWYTSFSYLGAAIGIWILANNQQKWMLVVNSAGAFGNVLMNLILIPRLGICGAAVASLVTQFFTNIVVGLFIVPIRRGYQLAIMAFDPKGWKEEILEVLHYRKRKN